MWPRKIIARIRRAPRWAWILSGVAFLAILTVPALMTPSFRPGHDIVELQSSGSSIAEEEARWRMRRNYEEDDAFAKAMHAPNPAALREFIRRFPNSRFIQVARFELKQIEESTRVAASPAKKGIPVYPWPPPAASASYVLPQSLFENRSTIAAVTTAIISALERNGYVERSFFSTPSGGVALVTRLERISDDGSSLTNADRWPTGPSYKYAIGDLARFLHGMFYAEAGRYRVIVFIIQDEPFSQDTKKTLSSKEARELLPRGANTLPRELATRPAVDSHCTALIYEFSSDGTAAQWIESRWSGKHHLQKAGVLSLLEKVN